MLKLTQAGWAQQYNQIPFWAGGRSIAILKRLSFDKLKTRICLLIMDEVFFV